MSIEIASIIGLAIMFVIATALPINMGAIAFVGAFAIGLLADMSTRDIFAGFPGDLFVTLVGITYLFAIAQKNGTIDWLVRKAVWIVQGRIAAMPWVMFTVTGILTSVGAVSPAAVAIIAPIALSFAYKYRISPLLMGLMVIHGAQAGGFSPVSIYGSITNQVVRTAELPGDEITLFMSSLAVNLIIAVIIFLFLDGHRATRSAVDMIGNEQTRPEAPDSGLNLQRICTLTGLVVLAVGSLAFDLNVGLVAISVAVLLTLLSPEEQKNSVDQVSWSTVLLICGVITYIAVLQKVGTVDMVGNSVTSIGIPLVGALLLCYIGGIVSAFASSVAVLGATIPLAVPFLLQGNIGPVGVVAAIAVASTIVDVSPFSTNGALVVANAHGADKDRFFRQMLGYSAIVVAVGPLFVWLLLIVPGWL